MPQALIALPDVYDSVIRRIAIDSVSQLARVMRLPPDTQIMLPGNAQTVPMNNGSFGECGDPGLNYPTDGRLIISFTEELDDSQTLSQHAGTAENLPLFEDVVRSTVIFPVYRSVTMNLNLQYIAPNQNIAQRWLDEMRTRVVQLRAELYQTLEYHYAIPNPILMLLHEVWSKIEASDHPSNLSFSEYLDEYLSRPTTVIDTIADTAPTRAVIEKQYEVLGWFDFTSTPEQPEKDGANAGNYICNINYRFSYDRPMQMLVRWPLVVHNQIIDSTYHPTEPYQTFRQVDRRVSFFKGSLESFLESIKYNNIPYVIEPEIDDWMPSEMNRRAMIFFTGLLVIDKTDPTHLVDLSHLGKHTFTPYILEYFFQQQHTLFGDRTSPFVFMLFENGQQRTDITFSFKPNSLELVVDKPLDMTKMYHLQIGILRDWTALTTETRQCLRRYPVVTYSLFRVLNIVLGEKEFKDLMLLGTPHKRIAISNCPGQGSLIGPPDKGGTWPWPWLDPEWGNYPWPGYDPRFDKYNWPGGSLDHPVIDLPTWPGADGEHGDNSGVIRNDDIEDAIDHTDGYAGKDVIYSITTLHTVMFAQVFVYGGYK